MYMDLPDHQIQVWWAWLDRPPYPLWRLSALLSSDEVSRARRFHFERDRIRFVTAHGMLRILLGHYLALPPQEIQIAYGRNGKPLVADCHGTDGLQFNLSHSEALAVYAFAWDRRVGVDAEYIRPISEVAQLAHAMFTPFEHQLLASVPEGERTLVFFNLWTRAEAYLKACGEGLSGSARRQSNIEITGSKVTEVESDLSRTTWRFESFTPVNGYIAAIAAEGTDWQMCSQQLAHER